MPALVSEVGQGQVVGKPVQANAVFNQTSRCPLDYITVSVELYHHLYGDEPIESESKYCSIKLVSEMDMSKFEIYEIHCNDQLRGITVEFNNITNLMQYKNQITVTTCMIIAVPKPIVLLSLIVAFPLDVFQLLKRVPRDNLFPLLSDSDEKLFRENDLIRNLNGKVVQCEPLTQGLISRDTEITIVQYDPPERVIPTTKIEDISFGIRDYLSLELDNSQDIVTTLKTDYLTHKLRLFSPQPAPKDDDEIFGFVRLAELSQIGCFSGDIMKTTVGGKTRYIKIFGLAEPNQLSPRTIYLSPIYLINMGNPLSLPICHTDHDISRAKKVTIARVASPVTLNRTYQHLFLSNLKNQFENKNRIVSKDQLIPIPLDSILASSLSSDDNTESLPDIIPEGNCDLIAWFKITDIESEDDSMDQYLIDPSYTKMIQSGVVTQAPPNNDLKYYQYLGVGDVFSYTDPDFKYAQTYKKLLQTTLLGPSLRTSILLHSQTRGIGKSLLVSNIAIELGIHVVEIDGYEVYTPGSELKTVGLIRGKVDRVLQSCSPLIVHFKHVEALVQQKDQQSSGQGNALILKITELVEEYLNMGAIVVASTNDADNLSDSFRSKFKFEIEFNVPTQNERYEIFKYYLRNLHEFDNDFQLRNDVSINSLSLQSAGLTPRDLMSIVQSAKNLALEQLEEFSQTQSIHFKKLYYMNGGFITLTPQVFEKAINDARNKFSDSIGAPKIPNVKWEDVGGLDIVKDDIMDTIDMPMKHPELFANGLKKRSGILFYGPPGTGKTLLAKAIATNFSLNFFSVKGPELLNMYIGESEANVRKVFQKARDSKPCVVFFDELDSVAPKRGNQGDSGGVMDRIVSQLLAELDGMSSDGGDGVFVVGATNRPDLLDDALLRPGRFDKMLYLGISDTDEKQFKILQALTRNFKLDDNLDLMKVAHSCAFNFTGADFYALCSDSILNSMIRLSSEVDHKVKELNKTSEQEINTRQFFENYAKPEDTDVVVKEEDFLKLLASLSPSVSQDELQHYLNIKKSFESN